MSGLMFACLAMVMFASQPLAMEVERSVDTLLIRLELLTPLPESIENSLVSGTEVRLRYPYRVYARRRIWMDNRIAKGSVETTATFDAVTGRYVCQMFVDGKATVGREFNSADAVRSWLTAPPPIELPLSPARQDATLRVRFRAVFAIGTAWLIFPSSEGTEWVETILEANPDGK